MAAASSPTATAEAKKMDENENAFEKAAPRTPAVITNADEYRAALLRWQERHYHILTPFAGISGLAPAHVIYSTMVQIDIDKNTQEIYDGLPFLKKGEVALAKRGLRKIAEGLGISTRLEYISVGRFPHYWHVKAIASYRGVDGATVDREASQEWDLRDGSDRMRGWTANQIAEARKHGLRQCETRAINAAIRECGCGIKQAYAAEELKRPFAAVRVMFQPDMSDPEQKRMLLERSFGSTSTLYPGASRGAQPPADAFDEGDGAGAVSVGSGSTSSAAAATSTPDPNIPPVEGAVRIEKVDTKSGEKNGRKWTRFIIIDSNGQEHSTFDKSLADAAEKAIASKAWVEIVEETDGQYRNLVEIAPAGQSPTLPGLENL